MKRFILLAAALVILGGLFARRSEGQPSKEALDRLMEQKLKSTQQLLAGLAMADFRKIENSAENLIQLSKTAEWVVYKTPRYEMHSNDFRRTAEIIIEKARQKNLDGSALAFFDMTMSCLRCHQYVRQVRDARLSEPGKEGIADGAQGKLKTLP
jgi:hypothetical protein